MYEIIVSEGHSNVPYNFWHRDFSASSTHRQKISNVFPRFHMRPQSVIIVSRLDYRSEVALSYRALVP
jgi:hypothetical protein